MQATLDVTSLKQLTRALTCISRYGEDLVVYATPDTFALSITNSSKSAYCRFKYGKQFFSRYKVGGQASGEDADEVPSVMGQLIAKNLLYILKHRTVEKSVDKCELSITDGDRDAGGPDDEDTLESRLTVRLHCKHGVVKTHRLLLLTPTTPLLAPSIPDPTFQSRLAVGPRAMRDMIEHFPFVKGPKSDPQLIWNFGETDVEVKSIEASIDSKGRAQLATELTISAEEFDNYEIYEVPTTIAFHLREFNATIAFAEASSLALEISFTDPAEPIFIHLDGDVSEMLFVIATTQARGETGPRTGRRGTSVMASTPNAQPRGQKRPREDDTAPSVTTSRSGSGSREGTIVPSRPSRATQSSNSGPVYPEGSMPPPASIPRPASFPPPASVLSPELMPPPSFPRFQAASAASASPQHEPLFLPSSQPYEEELIRPGMSQVSHTPLSRTQEPLFLPGTQLSQADQYTIRSSGLGIENMTAEEFADMLEGEGEEVDFGDGKGEDKLSGQDDEGEREGSLNIYEEMQATQVEAGTRTFRPLFED
ncbi:uncharacterized protein LAESUDRAFT_722303 [Laetiporus sulphureus 93-53]|uniref:Rad9-domain-containing protein n=1 Tax=Laetiporus sulphureus 93-53 TaxID=1314785 RepID=A0A165GC22_9APHY|nr:uncharacterized protein LAESUDRAFT_722303 [Laetiporus sulphureus 93-53]KZT10137.1 hypothetical protein LAESUDRAFT_722303 [Laetiporus sulphureus 93-53]